MKKIAYLSFSLFLFISCEKSESVIIETQIPILTVHSIHEHYSTGELFDKCMLYIYESEEEYNKPFGKHIIAIRHMPFLNKLDYGFINLKSDLYNLQPVKYWIKIFNPDKSRRYVDYNSSSFTLEYPLIENTNTSVIIPMKRVYLNSYEIQKIEIYKFPDWINSNIGDKVMLKFVTHLYYHNIPEWLLDKQEITVSDSFITYMPDISEISQFGTYSNDPNFYVVLSNENSPPEEFYQIDIFNLISSNKCLGSVYSHFNDKNELIFKLYVKWNVY